MNDINPDLEFTVETADDFEDKKLPTLDFCIWQEEDGSINHTYYQKPIKSPYVIMERSSMSKQQKLQILANEMTRRLSNINKKRIKQEEYNRVVDQMSQELKNSGYTRKNAVEIISSGIRGWKARISRQEKAGQDMYRNAARTLTSRTRKKLISRENWYKKNKNTEADNTKQIKTQKNRKTENKNKKNENNKQHKTQELQQVINKNQKTPEKTVTRAVMFVPFTPNSELAKLLRENEEQLEKITGTKLKIVERTGVKLVDLLTRSNPWQGYDCTRLNCLLCYTKSQTEKLKTQECNKRNLVYETRCLTCEDEARQEIENEELEDKEKKDKKNKIRLYKYIGETSRSTYERGWEHCNDLAQLNPRSHMLKHCISKHPGQDMSKVKFGMKVVKYCKTSFDRQIQESVLIQKERQEHHLLNSRTEYNRCSLPRISTQVGDIEFKEYSKELEQEKLEEVRIDKKIRELRKERNKARLHPTKESGPRTKKRKVDKNHYVSIGEIWGRQEGADDKKTPEKCEKNPPPKQENDEKNYDDSQEGTWEKRLEKVEKDMEQEQQEWNNWRQEKEAAWELQRICKEYLEKNSKDWEKMKKKRQEEFERQERLGRAKSKTRKAQIKYIEKKIEEGLNKMPKEKRVELETEERERQEKELQEAKRDLWTLKGREKKVGKPKKSELEKIKGLAEKSKKIGEILKIERERVEIEKKLEQDRIEKNKKYKESKKERFLKIEKLREKWAMNRWVTEFIAENEEKWEKWRGNEIAKMKEWEKLERHEKIKLLKEKYKNKNGEMKQEILNEKPEVWKAWRDEKSTKKP